MKVGPMNQSDVMDGGYYRILEPGILVERQEVLASVGEEPDAVPSDVLNFNR